MSEHQEKNAIQLHNQQFTNFFSLHLSLDNNG